MAGLASLVERAEALEAAGKYREAAELTAEAMTQAHSKYVQSHVCSAHFQSQELLRLPTPMLPMPRRSYIERYKARLRVDWQKWDRVSRRNLNVTAVEGNGDSDEDDDDEEGAGLPSPSAAAELSLSGSVRAAQASISSDTEESPDEWKPETLDKHEDSTGHIELIHTMSDGSKVTVVTIVRPQLPSRAMYLFNRETKQTMKKLLKGEPEDANPKLLDNGRTYTHAEVARWLLTAPKLSKNKIGDYLGRSDDDAKEILKAFLAELDFSQFTFDEALRFFLSTFRLPGEAQQIDRIVQNFAERYHALHPGVFSMADTAYVLAFSIIMLNTDAHSAQIEHKMTLAQFLRNNRGIDNGGDLPDELMTDLYRKIVANEIRMEQREYIAADKEGWLFKQGGRWKSWKRRYTILSGNVLYYFKDPKDRTPAGFVPLEGIEVREVAAKLVFELRATDERVKLKSARMDPSGKGMTFLQGHHSVFRFKVDGGAEHLDAWVQAVRAHSVAGQVRTTASASATAKEEVSKPMMSFFRGKAKPGATPGVGPSSSKQKVDEVSNKQKSLTQGAGSELSGSSAQWSSIRSP